ncbi:MAG: glycosyltransferase family 2 protein [Proteobacteria bacterium]|nr:glycosyltransferase family 2 protein [Pseudomonadota bacterium]
MTETDIIIPIYNRLEDTRTCLTRLARHTDAPFRLILIDNCSDEPMARWLAEAAREDTFGPTTLIRNEVNRGWTGATNQGLARAEAEYVCLLNNDTLPGPGWLGRMLAHFRRLENLAMMSPRGDESSENRRVEDRIEEFAQEIARRCDGKWRELDHCSGFCLVMPRRIYEELGPFDETYSAGNWADNDYARRAQERGWFCAEARDAFVFHLGHRTFDDLDEAWRRQSAQNEAAFYARWGRPRRIFLAPVVALEGESEAARAELAALYALARQGHRLWVPLLRRERIGRVLADLGLPEHANIRFLIPPLPWPLSRWWAAWRWRYLRKKGRALSRHEGPWVELDPDRI